VEFSVEQAVKQPELFVFPFKWTILHVVSVFANHEFLASMPNYSEFKMPFLLDAFERTPFHYLTAHKDFNFLTASNLFRYICDYLEDCQLRDPYEFQKVIRSLSPLLSTILQKIETKQRQRFLSIIDAKSSGPDKNPIPLFGNILSESAVFCQTPVLTNEIRDQIWNSQGTTQVEFRSNYLYLDYNILSKDMKDLIHFLKMQTSQHIFKRHAIATLIDHLWLQVETPLRVFFMFYSIFIVSLSVYLTLEDRCLPYEIALLIISVIFTGNEFLQIFHLKKSYLESLWNWFDITHLLFTIAFLGTRLANNDYELARAWMSTVIVLFGYFRWISFLTLLLWGVLRRF